MRNKKAMIQVVVIVILTVMTSLISGTASAQLFHVADKQPIIIEQWQSRFFHSEANFKNNDHLQQLFAEVENGYWKNNTGKQHHSKRSAQSRFAWIKFNLPAQLDFERPALYIDKLYGQNMLFVMDNQILSHSVREYPYMNNSVLLPLTSDDNNKSVYILLETESNRIGLHSSPMIGNIDSFDLAYTKQGITDIILGAVCFIIGLLILLGSSVIIRARLRSLYWLGFMIMLIGIILITYSTYMYSAYPKLGMILYYLSEVSVLLFGLVMFITLESLFGKGSYQLIAKLKYIQLGVVIIGCIWLFSSFFNADLLNFYMQIRILLLGCSIFASLTFSIVFFIYSLNEKNKEAILFLSGFSLFLLCIIMEQLLYFAQEGDYSFYLWKWGMLCIMAVFILLYIRQYFLKYEQLLLYSKQLELLNNELQRSEKLEIMNQIAASVAHEIRNPIQVTRGFLQLLWSNSLTPKEVGYVELAISELDRATEIITDFLNFAKPQYERNSMLKINDELFQIKAIIYPLAVIHGHQIEMRLEPDLYVRGASSDFKQALINIIKNSIESIKSEGIITIQAYKRIEKDQIIILVEDNGEGIKESDLKRLGEPFYSKKMKGTGIGLNVTFKIVESMNGQLLFYSQLGQGTQVKIVLPMAEKETEAIN